MPQNIQIFFQELKTEVICHWECWDSAAGTVWVSVSISERYSSVAFFFACNLHIIEELGLLASWRIIAKFLRWTVNDNKRVNRRSQKGIEKTD